MNKTKFIVLLFLFTSICFANNVLNNTIRLSKNFKRLSSFSGDLNDTHSFHLIFTKNKDTDLFTVYPYLFDGTTVEELAVFENKKKYPVVSFHKENNALSVLLSFKIAYKNFIQKVDIDVKSKEIIQKEPMSHDDFIHSFREKNRSILIYKDRNEFSIKQFCKSRAVVENRYELKGDIDKIKELFQAN